LSYVFEVVRMQMDYDDPDTRNRKYRKMTVSSLTPEDLSAARQRILPQLVMTPVMRSDALDRQLGCHLHFKCEQLQITGSFKFRGASHAVSLLPDDAPGVATHSSGNHGAALARAARARGLPAHIVMPENAVRFKIEAVKANGGEVHFCAPNQAAREAGLADWVERGFVAVPPYDDDRIIAGQGSCALEFIEQIPHLEFLIAPVGGGGLLAGTALAAAGMAPAIKVVGAEPANADDTARSLARGLRVDDHHPETIADGLRALVGLRNLDLIQRHVAEVVTVSESRIVDAMTLIWTHLKQVVEPSGAVSLAALIQAIETRPEAWAGRHVGLILSGGNLDIEPIMERWRR
jgi:threonine dehydratase